jgi:hypothetical protein
VELGISVPEKQFTLHFDNVRVPSSSLLGTEHAKSHGYDSAHLVLIAGQPDKTVRSRVERYAAARGLTVTFLLYRVQMDLLAHP